MTKPKFGNLRYNQKLADLSRIEDYLGWAVCFTKKMPGLEDALADIEAAKRKVGKMLDAEREELRRSNG